MLNLTETLRPKSEINYPNYHSGKYFEEFFFDKFITSFPNLEINDFNYIPIFWTNCYTNKTFSKKIYDIQNILNQLDKTKKYFTISQHDDCIYERLPDNTIIFSMGGNKTGKNIIPIPLICSPIKYEKKEKNIKISFVGSLTHPLRNSLYETYRNDSEFFFKVKNWELVTDHKNVLDFMNIMSRSIFSLCPRGYGKTSFRLYESMQLDSIPVYIYDDKWLPWENEIDWNRLVILISKNELHNIKDKINSSNIRDMLSYKNKVYNEFFTYNGVYDKILNFLKK